MQPVMESQQMTVLYIQLQTFSKLSTVRRSKHTHVILEYIHHMSRNNQRSKQNSFTNIDLLSCSPLLLSYAYKTTYQSQEKNSPNFFAKSSSRSKLSLPSSAKTLSFFHVSASYLLVPALMNLFPVVLTKSNSSAIMEFTISTSNCYWNGFV